MITCTYVITNICCSWSIWTNYADSKLTSLSSYSLRFKSPFTNFEKYLQTRPHIRLLMSFELMDIEIVIKKNSHIRITLPGRVVFLSFQQLVSLNSVFRFLVAVDRYLFCCFKAIWLKLSSTSFAVVVACDKVWMVDIYSSFCWIPPLPASTFIVQFR